MANKNITVTKTENPNVPKELTFTEIGASDTAVIPCGFKDEHTFLIIQNAGGGSANVTIKAGNGYAGVADEVFAVANGKTAYLTIDSARFKNVSGENSGKMLITASANVSLAVAEARV